MSWPGFRASSADFTLLRQLSTDGSNGDDGGGGGGSRLDGRRTNRTKVLRSSRNTDRADNMHTDNTHIHRPGSHSCRTPGTQIRSRPTHLRQSAVPPQKRIRLPPNRLREVFSNSYNLPPDD
jgi:hypothetical protein